MSEKRFTEYGQNYLMLSIRCEWCDDVMHGIIDGPDEPKRTLCHACCESLKEHYKDEEWVKCYGCV